MFQFYWNVYLIKNMRIAHYNVANKFKFNNNTLKWHLTTHRNSLKGRPSIHSESCFYFFCNFSLAVDIQILLWFKILIGFWLGFWNAFLRLLKLFYYILADEQNKLSNLNFFLVSWHQLRTLNLIFPYRSFKKIIQLRKNLWRYR